MPRILLLQDVRAVDVGLDFGIGLLGKKGDVIDALFPVADKLINSGLARVARDDEHSPEPKKRGLFGKKQAHPETANKQAHPAKENKSHK